MYNLVQNENMKIYVRIRTWILIVIMLLAVLAQGALTYSFMPKEENPNWKQEVKQQNEELQKAMTDQEFPMPAELKESTVIEIRKNEYAIEHNLDPSRMTGWEFVRDATALMTLVTIFVSIIAGDIVASEFSWGTIKLLLIRPVSRAKILLAKYLAVLSFTVLMLVVLFAWSWLVGGMFFGFGGINEPYIYSDSEGKIHETQMFRHVWLTYGLELLSLLVIVTFSFLLSTAFRSSSLAISMSILLMFVGNIIVSLLSRYEWVKYTLFANLDLMGYIEGSPVIEGMTLSFSVIALMIYLVVFYAIAWLVFVRRDVTV